MNYPIDKNTYIVLTMMKGYDCGDAMDRRNEYMGLVLTLVNIMTVEQIDRWYYSVYKEPALRKAGK